MGVVGSRHTSYFGHRNSPKINSGRRNGGCRTFTAIRKKSKVGRRNGSHDFGLLCIYSEQIKYTIVSGDTSG